MTGKRKQAWLYILKYKYSNHQTLHEHDQHAAELLPFKDQCCILWNFSFHAWKLPLKIMKQSSFVGMMQKTITVAQAGVGL